MSVVIIDNYDSFTHNLEHAFASVGATTQVVRNDALDRAGIAALQPDAIVLSPGPGNPDNRTDFGVCADVIADPLDVPMLGVCLGMQGMASCTGGRVVPAPSIVHGEADTFQRADHAVFQGLPAEPAVGRYHSLCVEPSSLPQEWEALGTTPDGTLMAMAHHERPWIGLQFHPESILTPDGPAMIRNFLEMT